MKTLRILAVGILLFYAPLASSQSIHLNLKGKVIKKISAGTVDFEVGDSVVLTGLANGQDNYQRAQITSLNGVKRALIYHSDYKKRVELASPITLEDIWGYECYKGGVYDNIIQNGYQYGYRNDLDQLATDVLGAAHGYTFDDDYLEDYLYQLLRKVYPRELRDGRPGNLAIKIAVDPTPNAVCYPNGLMFITTGLLSLIDSEEELIAVLAHEVAHFELDHYILNKMEEVRRKKNADLIAGIATAMAAATEVYLAAEKDVFLGGSLTMGVASLSTAISQTALEEMGLKFSQDQEAAADQVALRVLGLLDINPAALASVLKKLNLYDIRNGRYMTLAGKTSHPSLTWRIGNAKRQEGYVEQDYYSVKYHRKISFITTMTARHEYANAHFVTCNDIVDKNIKSEVAVEDDYYLKARVTSRLYNSKIKNEESLAFIKKGKSLNVTPRFELYKEEGLINLRLKDKAGAKSAFGVYDLSLLEFRKARFGELSPANLKWIYAEMEWARQMIYKVDLLK